VTVRLDFATMLPLVSKLGDFLKNGFDAYVQLKASGADLTPDILGAVLVNQMDGWNPKMNGREVLDPETKAACARFLAGVAFNASNRS
jgi:hypothetical protein